MKTIVIIAVVALPLWNWMRNVMASSETVAIPDGSRLPGNHRAPASRPRTKGDPNDPMGDDRWDPINTPNRGRPLMLLDRLSHHRHDD